VARPYPLLFALCLPLVFLHADYQASWTVGVASSEATLFLSDVAVLAAGVVAVLAGRAQGFGVLRAGRPVWLAAAAFLAVALVWTFVGLEVTDRYPLAENLLTLAKLTLYALLAVGAALVYRSLDDLRPLLNVVVAWSCIATAFGVLQYFGVVDEFEGPRPGQREPSFLGIHDFGALSGATLAIGLIGIAQGRRGRLTWAATVSGVVGVVLSGAIAVVLGVAAAAVAAWLLTRQRALALAAVVAVVCAGAVAIRVVDPEPLLDLLGIEQPLDPTSEPGASWEQRVALAYIGGRIFLDHPLVGVGWQASERRYGPYLDDARSRFPDVPELALPSPEHEWGVQNAYVQAAADMGVVGLAAWLALFLVPLSVAWRVGEAAAVPILWLLVAMGVWIGLGLVAGNPVAALTWLSVGLAAAAASWREPG
jgi:O-antigen ligase